MKYTHLLLLVGAVFLITAGIATAAYSHFIILETREIPMDMRIGNDVGVTVDTDALHFGMIRQGGTAGRRMMVKNTFETPVTVTVDVRGDLAPWSVVEPSNVRLQPGEETKLHFTIIPPASQDFGNYTGTAILFFKRI